jgi:CRISPR type III-A-associated RAMP protein Csm4
MDIYKVRLVPCGGITRLPDSQTLFGGICWAIRDLYGEDILEDMLDNFYNHKNRFVVSSVFPKGLVSIPMEIWITAEEIGKILDTMKNDNIQIIKRAKALKKAKYMTLNVIRQYLQGNLDRKELYQSILLSEEKGNYKLVDNVVAFTDEVVDILSYKTDKGKRNCINRKAGTTQDGNLFYYDRIFLDNKLELYFFIKVDNIEFFEPIFKYLSDCALGSDKSIGSNSYKLELDGKFTYDKKISESILLSKYIPYYEEVDWSKSYFKIGFGKYKIESRFEFMGENVFKDEVGYLTEGSKVLLLGDKKIYGQLPIVKVLRDKKVRHNGLGFFL